MIDEPEDNEQNGKTKGETDGSFGDGKAGAASGVGLRLTVGKAKQVHAEHRHLMGESLVESIVEFFNDALVASANLVVTFVEKAKTFAVVNWTIEAGQKMHDDYVKSRERTRGADSQGLKQKRQKSKTKTYNPNTGPTGAQ